MRRLLYPSDLAYLWDTCQRCFWLKARGYEFDRDKLPKVFEDIDRGMKAAFSVEDLNALALPAVSVTPGRWVQSAWMEFPGGVSLAIKGQADFDALLEDGTTAVVDGKSSVSSPERLERRFWRQLESYALCYENPAEGEPVSVSKLGLLVFGGTQFRFDREKRCGALFGGVQLFPVARMADQFQRHLGQIAELLSEDHPPPRTASCTRCAMVDRLARLYGESVPQPSATMQEPCS